MNLFLTSTTIPESSFKKIQEISNKNSPKIAIVDIAAKPYFDELGKDPDWLISSLDDLENLGFVGKRFFIDKKSEYQSLWRFWHTFDGIFLTGGNSFVLNYWIHEKGLDEVIEKFVNSKKFIIGSSAGSIVLTTDIEHYASIDDPSKADEQINSGVNLFPHITIVHWKNEKYQAKLEKIEAKYIENSNNKIYYIEDTQCIYFDGENIEYCK